MLATRTQILATVYKAAVTLGELLNLSGKNRRVGVIQRLAIGGFISLFLR
jgi:hypothetical protein